MIRLVGLIGGLAVSVIGLSLNWIEIPEENLSATGFDALNLASAFLVVLALGVFMLFYFDVFAQRVLSMVLAIISVYLMFISANSLLNSSPIIDRLVSVRGAVGTNPETEFSSLAIAVYFIGIGFYCAVLVYNLFRPRRRRAAKRIAKSAETDDAIGIWDNQD